MHLAHATIDISASPQVVRDKFLDFSQLPNYHPNGFFKSVGPTVPGKPIEAGDKLNVVFQVGSSTPLCLENSPSCFRWVGNIPGFRGEHSFRFEPSTKIQGWTTFTQEEKFTGALSFLMGDGLVARSVGLRENTKTGWEKYNQDLKAWCER